MRRRTTRTSAAAAAPVNVISAGISAGIISDLKCRNQADSAYIFLSQSSESIHECSNDKPARCQSAAATIGSSGTPKTAGGLQPQQAISQKHSMSTHTSSWQSAKGTYPTRISRERTGTRSHSAPSPDARLRSIARAPAACRNFRAADLSQIALQENNHKQSLRRSTRKSQAICRNDPEIARKRAVVARDLNLRKPANGSKPKQPPLRFPPL